MIKLNLTPKQKRILLDVLESRDYDEGSILYEAGIQCWDGLQALLRAIENDGPVEIKVAEMLAGEAEEYADLWGKPLLLAVKRRIVEAIGLHFGIQPPKPKPKPNRPTRVAPVFEPSVKRTGEFKLRSPEGSNGYCGPTSIAGLMGTTTDMVAKLARRVNGRPSIRGMYIDEALSTIKQLGGRIIPMDTYLKRSERPTLAKWHREVYSLRKDVPRVLVLVTGHYVAIHGDDVLCSMQPGRSVRNIAFAAAARKKVERVWQIA